MRRLEIKSSTIITQEILDSVSEDQRFYTSGRPIQIGETFKRGVLKNMTNIFYHPDEIGVVYLYADNSRDSNVRYVTKIKEENFGW